VGHDLVDIHVALRARAGLPDRERKLGVELAGRDALGRVGNRLRLRAIEQTQIAVHAGCGPLEPGQRMDHLQRHALLANCEKMQAACRLGAPERVGGHLNRPEAVGLGACVAHGVILLRNVDMSKSKPR